MKSTRILIVLVATLLSTPATADAVKNIYGSKLPIYADNAGTNQIGTIQRDNVKLPAAIMGNKSPHGLYYVRFEHKNSGKEAISGWIKSRGVRIDRNATIKVPGCGSSSKQMATVTRGTRGLGKGCK